MLAVRLYVRSAYANLADGLWLAGVGVDSATHRLTNCRALLVVSSPDYYLLEELAGFSTAYDALGLAPYAASNNGTDGAVLKATDGTVISAGGSTLALANALMDPVSIVLRGNQ